MVILPIINPIRTATHSQATLGAHQANCARRIHIVDDNIDAVESLAEILRSLGHTVDTATTGTEALANASIRWPEIFILDIGLPDMDGYELVRRLRECESTAVAQNAKTTQFIALTGYGQAHDKVLSKSAGFDFHLVKPVDLNSLLERLS